MKRAYKVIRTILVSLLSLAVGIPLLLYILLCLPGIHNYIRDVASDQLSELLGAEVNIGGLNVEPFNRVELTDVSIVLEGDTVLTSSALNAGISVRNLVSGRIVITDVELMDPDVRLWRAFPDAPLNIQPILDRLKGEEGKPPTAFDLAVHTVAIRGGRASYDVLSEPQKSALDPNHLAVTDLRADITAPKVSNDRVTVNLKRLRFTERSGLTLRNLAARVDYTPDSIRINGLKLALPQSEIDFTDMTLRIKDSHRIGVIEMLNGSHVNPADLAPLFEPLEELDSPVEMAAKVELFTDSLNVEALSVKIPSRNFALDFRGDASRRYANIPAISLKFNAGKALGIVNLLSPLPEKTEAMLSSLGDVSFVGSASWADPRKALMTGMISTGIGKLNLSASLRDRTVSGQVKATDLDLTSLLPGKEMGHADFSASFNLSKTRGHASVNVGRFSWRGHTYHDVDASLTYAGKEYRANVSLTDSLASLTAEGLLDLTPGNFRAEINADIDRLQLYEIGLWNKYPGYILSGEIVGAFAGEEPLRPAGELTVSHLRFTDAEGNGLMEEPVKLTADLSRETDEYITLRSNLLTLDAHGAINLKTLPAVVNNLLAQSLPELFDLKVIPVATPNDFTLTAQVNDRARLLEFLNLPVKFLFPISIEGEMNQTEDYASLEIRAPYIQKGNSLITKSSVKARLGSESALTATTQMPSKFGEMLMSLEANVANGLADVNFLLNNPEEDSYSGRITLAARPYRRGADIEVRPGVFNFGNTNWTIAPTDITIRDGVTAIDNLSIHCPGQNLRIGGRVSSATDDELTLSLSNINLDDIFAALRMNDVVQFGGIASGVIRGSALLSGEPEIRTDDLYVEDLSYGHCVMGNTHLLSHWNNETRGIEIRANVKGKKDNGLMSVNGVIYPKTQELDFKFHARHAPMGFLHTFMKNWASKVGGHASGDAHLYGDFKYVDLTGDFYAENFALTIGFTNVTYFTTDSVHIRPGVIKLDNLKIHDSYGHTAKVNGRLTHDFFANPRFNFRISDMDRMLAYDVAPSFEVPWSGRIFANGVVNISGVPGHCDVTAEVTSAPGSEFTFELSENQNALEYNFLTFRDVTPKAVADSTAYEPGSPELDHIMSERVRKNPEKAALTNYDFNLIVGLNPDIKMTLVMDPVAGDKIEGVGSGSVTMQYGSSNEELRLSGTYVLNSGVYNFSLQDIILKKFTILPGSSVAFSGDPYDAELNISAVYQLYANLSDLDETFLTDPELKNTTVPVQAVVNITDHMLTPDIKFDLNFPNLRDDIKRKVKAIVSTEEQMSQQIIYLLGLNKFYTPDYMSTTTKGNELMAVASGTLSSQLSNILGHLTDKLTVAPSLRSDSKDFSDLEVDVALSSTLLNNRLLLNGNFGYRDNALNNINSQFIGDFDAEYLLTPRGNWRLKAYNHFNDQNLYVKNALTTQGIGLIFKHDFDNLFRCPRKNRKK